MKKISKKLDHFVVFYDQNSKAEQDIDEISKSLELSYEKIIKELKLFPLSQKIKFFLYETVNEKVKETDERAYGHTDRKAKTIFAVYNKEIKCIGPHEIVHIFIAALGFSNYVLGEGLAESMEEGWTTKNVSKSQDEWVRDFRKNNQFVPITTLFDDHEFIKHDCTISYPEAGSFVKFLLKKYGSEKVLEVFKALERRGDLKKNLEAFKDRIGQSVEEAEKEWLESLQ